MQRDKKGVRCDIPVKDIYTVCFMCFVNPDYMENLVYAMTGCVVSIIFQFVLVNALYKYMILSTETTEEQTVEIMCVKVFMMYLYAARSNMNIRSSYIMMKHKYDHKIRGFAMRIPIYMEMICGIQNMIVGYIYIKSVETDEVFEALIYGFFIIEIPKFVL